MGRLAGGFSSLGQNLGPVAGRGLPDQRLELLAQLAELFLAEAGSGPAGIHQLALDVVAELKRAEAAPASLWRGEPHHYEFLGLVGPHLEPLGRPAGPIGRIGRLADHPLEPEHGGVLHEGEAVPVEMLEVADRAQGREQHPEDLLPLHRS